MDLDIGLLVVGGLGVAVVFGSRLLRSIPLTPPLVALAVGVGIGPRGLDLAQLDHGISLLHGVSEVAVAVALVAVALRFPWSKVALLAAPVGVMVTVGMVAMAGIVAALAWLLLDVSPAVALLIGGVLAPTDPVLSSGVVTGNPATRTLPERVRALLSVESGINDGLALPLVVAGTVLVLDHGGDRFVIEGLWSVVLALVVGAAAGTAAGEVFRRLDEARDIEDSAFFVFTLVLAVAVLGGVNLIHGDGILAVYVAGLAYNRQVGSSTYDKEREVDEGINRVLVLPLFVLLGTLLPWERWGELGAPLLWFGLGVLVLRRLPVVYALRPALGLRWSDATFYGWFGPMGAAALYFATRAHEEGAAADEVWPIAAFVVTVSTLVHGVTGTPARVLYQRVEGERGDHDEDEESEAEQAAAGGQGDG
jgi:NhaP-type Na+/H+ or K+/H+ antiporter